MGFNHFDENGNAVMVDVSGKNETARKAVACGIIYMSAETFDIIKNHRAAKGDVLGVARIAGIMAAKKTSELIPLCHPLMLSNAAVEFELLEDKMAVVARCTVKVHGLTGVEMEALTGVSVTLLTIYDMCKAVDKRMRIGDIHLEYKEGGKSGRFIYE